MHGLVFEEYEARAGPQPFQSGFGLAAYGATKRAYIYIKARGVLILLVQRL